MIKKLQNNFTTPEQSKRLLELGVPADSADCYYTNMHMTIWIRNTIDRIDWGAKVGGVSFYTPCWSVGRLMEIMALCYKFDLPDSGSVQVYKTDIEKGIVIDVLISDIERFINKMDFSKLEE